ncbi:MAG: FAD:protein FMN transferase [Saccharofermentanales bacterium]
MAKGLMRNLSAAAATIFILSAAMLSSCIQPTGNPSTGVSSSTGEYTAYSRQFLGTFDTVVTVIGHLKTEEEFTELSDYAEKRFNELHKIYDIYNNYAGIVNARTINDNAGIAPVVISKDLMDLLQISLEWNIKTSGKVNIAMGSVLTIWHHYRTIADPMSEDNALPTAAELQQASLHTSISSLVLDPVNMTAYLTDPDSSIDLGAVAKGYTTELVCDELAAKGFVSFAISAGGNVKVVGKPLAKDRDTWIIGIQNPVSTTSPGAAEDLIDKVAVVDTCVVTSGWYQRYFRSGGKIYHHIIDPVTLYPQNYYKAVTIVCEDSGTADLLSTVLMLMSYEDGLAFIKTVPGADAYWILDDGTIKTTPGMDTLLVSKQS